MDIGVSIVLLLLFLATVVVIYALFNALASKSLSSTSTPKKENEDKVKEAMLSCEEIKKRVSIAKEQVREAYPFILQEIIHNITKDIKESAESGSVLTVYCIDFFIQSFIETEYPNIDYLTKSGLIGEFCESYSEIIQKYFEKSGFTVTIRDGSVIILWN